MIHDIEEIIKNEYFQVFWAVSEGVWVLTHIFVLLGIRNSTLDCLRRQQLYFFADGVFHTFNIVYYPLNEIGYFGYYNARLMLIIHIYFWLNLVLNPPSTPADNLKTVFHWSSVEFQDNRFNFSKYYVEIMGTLLDIIAHSLGCFLMMKRLNITYNILVFLGVIINTYIGIFIFYRKEFSTKTHMMPQILRKFSREKIN